MWKWIRWRARTRVQRNVYDGGPRAAVPMNQILSLVTLATALVVRCFMGSLIGVGAFSPAVIALGIGGVTAAWFAARLLSHISNHRLERAIAVPLVAIGLLPIG
jgi:hypothetical protein